MGSDIITAVAIVLIGVAIIFLRKRSLGKQTEHNEESNSEVNAKGKDRKIKKGENKSRRKEETESQKREFKILGTKHNAHEIESGGGGTEFLVTERIIIVHTDEDLPQVRN